MAVCSGRLGAGDTHAEGPVGFVQSVPPAAALWKKVICEPSLSDDALFAGLTGESPCVVAYCASALSRRKSPLLRQLPAGLLARSEDGSGGVLRQLR
jgi:hypothetical protein